MPEYTIHQKAIVFSLVALGLIATGISVNRRAAPARSGDVVQIVDEAAQAPKPSEASAPSAEIVVHVAGKVRRPGVYRLRPGERVYQAIQMAGGCLPNADTDALNLAARANDGEQIYVPSREETRTARAGGQMSAAVGGQAAANRLPAVRRVNLPALRIPRGSSSEKLTSPGEGTVNINTADEEELQRLPGVGPSTAQKIIAYRQQVGRFTGAEQLMDVHGIGPKKFETMAPFVRL